MHRVWFAVVGLTAGCGGGGEATIDAPIDAGPRCDPALPFAAPVLVGGINSDLDEAAARLSDDELEITFSRRSSGVWDLWRASRATIDDSFGAPVLITTVNSVSSDLFPTVSPDRLTLLFQADRTTPGVFHIWRSTRSSLTAPFGPPSPRPELRDDDVHPLLANDHALYFSSTVRGGLGGGEILRASVDPGGAIGIPELVVGGINTIDLEDTPAVTADERTMFFRRRVMGESDIYTASRSTATDGFGASSVVPGLDVAGVTEVPTWVSADGCHLYLYSDAPGASALMNVWVATRPPAP
ncbi:hypothetical protein BH11MYX3_BH11MYX3_16960 [soil metagenome]